MQNLARRITSALLASSLASVLAAQCERVWTSGSSFHGVEVGTVQAVHAWDPDGAGPTPMRWIFGGDFRNAGTSLAQNLVAHDPATGAWSELGLPADGPVAALATASNGDLVVGGSFTTIGGIPASRIARWDGSQWHALGGGTDGPVHALLRLQSGELAVGGAFAVAGGAAAARLARWTSAGTWAPGLGGAGAGFNGIVRALAQTANGHVYAGGDFTSLSPGGSMSRIARWNGTAWQALGTFSAGVTGPVHALTVSSAGDLVVGGDFASASGLPLNAGNLVRWNGSSFQAFGSGVGAPLGTTVRAVAALPNGDVIVGGSFATAGGFGSANVARWVAANNGWSPTGMGADSEVYALLALPSGDALAVGAFDTIGGVPALGIARRQLGNWTALAERRGADNEIRALTRDQNGDLLIGGNATRIDGVPMLGVARRTVSGWEALGSIQGSVRVLAVLPNGEVLAGGDAVPSGGFCLRWNGSQWVSLGTINGRVEAMLVRADGSLVIGGYFTTVNGAPLSFLALWNGAAWQPIGNLPIGPVHCIRELANGQLAVAGGTSAAQPQAMFAVWDGSAWSTRGAAFLGGPNGAYVANILERRSGELVLTGKFSRINGQLANGVASYHQGLWQPMGTPLAQELSAIVELPNEALLACAAPQSGPLLQWDGTAWQPTSTSLQGRAETMLLDGNQLLIAGQITAVDGKVARNLEALGNTCTATAVVAGSGCDGSNGTDRLIARNAPWIGGVFRAEASGLPTFGLRFAVWGFAPTSLPLAQVVPIAAPGCLLLADPVVVDLFTLGGPHATTVIGFPNDPTLIGLVLRHQHISIGLDALLQATEVTATNALVLTLGTL